MINKKYFILIILCLLFISLFSACTNTNNQDENLASSNQEPTNHKYSYKSQMDLAMEHISNPKALATVNDIEITQVDVDLYSIGGKTHTTEEIVKYYIITDYSEKNSIELNDWNKELYNNIERDMLNDEELSENYCLNTYGISKSEVIKYAQKRIYQIGMNSAFSSMIIEEVSNGETPQKYPQLSDAYNKFEKNKDSNPNEAWEDIENAYYEMIAEDYDIVIY